MTIVYCIALNGEERLFARLEDAVQAAIDAGYRASGEYWLNDNSGFGTTIQAAVMRGKSSLFRRAHKLTRATRARYPFMRYREIFGIALMRIRHNDRRFGV